MAAPKRGHKAHTRGQAALPLRPGERRRMAELSRDPDYLAVKEQLGEPLTPDERETLRAWRSATRALEETRGEP
jgi:hypothetical protein